MVDGTGRTFLGIGIGHPLQADAQGALQRAAYEESVRQSVWLILGTAPGERVMRPDFGCGINELVFANDSADGGGRIAAAVRDALLRFETRINVLGVQVGAGDDSATLLISIDYEVRATNNVFNLVYPFYADGAPS